MNYGVQNAVQILRKFPRPPKPNPRDESGVELCNFQGQMGSQPEKGGFLELVNDLTDHRVNYESLLNILIRYHQLEFYE